MSYTITLSKPELTLKAFLDPKDKLFFCRIVGCKSEQKCSRCLRAWESETLDMLVQRLQGLRV